MENLERCFSCNKPLKKEARIAYTFSGQQVFVGTNCYLKISAMGKHGYQPSFGGPRLHCTMESLCLCHWKFE